MKLTSLIAVFFIVFAATGSAAALFSKPDQTTIETIQKIEATTSSMMIMQRPI
jgi:hypothetical protein